MNSTMRGFTIVELLIVIVVIGILSTITVVTFSGIRERANQAKTLVAVDNYIDAFELYRLDHGALPVPDPAQQAGVLSTCLGEDYPAADGFAEGVCVKNGGGTATGRVNPAFNSLLKTTLSPLPDGRSPVVTIGGGTQVRGIYYTPGGAGGNISYYGKGDQSCGKGVKQPYSPTRGVTICDFSVAQ